MSTKQPFNSQSSGITGAIVALVSQLLVLYFGFEATEIQGIVLHGTGLVGILLAWYGRYRMGDVGLWGKRKAPLTPHN